MPLDSARLHWDTHAHDYQIRAAAHLYERRSAALWLQPGYGKTTSTLHAFKALKDAGLAENMLVVAPLRVVQTVWAQEIDHWASLDGLRACRLHGPKKDKWLRRRDVNVWLINYEGLPWLAGMTRAGKVPRFDVAVADEVRRFKNPTGHRFKMARPIFKLAKYRWGLTGTPASNGLMDLFGQFLMLDDGDALGTRITRFRHEYFEQGYDGFTYVPRPKAQERIEERVKHMVFRAEGKIDLPEFVYDTRTVILDAKARKQYTALKNDLIASLEGTTVTAANAAVLTGKLKQMANGRVYDEHHNVIKVHDAKADALKDLLEELGDEQLLIAYEYHHDLDQLREVLGSDLPYIGAGVGESRMNEVVAAWNAGKIPVLAAHPASAGHGINLQKSGAHHILWWGPTFDLDHYIQFNDRLRRQGNTADAVIVHTFVAEKTVDEVAVEARGKKETVQSALLKALTVEFGTTITIDRGKKETSMTSIQFKSDAQQAQTNPFAAQQPAQANPFAAQQPAQANPFAAQQPAQANPFAAQQPAQANPFAAQQSVQQQQEAIRQDVGAPPPPTPNQAFAAHGLAMGAPNPVRAQPNITATPEDRQPPSTGNPFASPQPIEDAVVVHDTVWSDPKSERSEAAAAVAAEAPSINVPTAAPEGMVPLYTFVPASKLDKLLSAIARALK